MQRWGGANVHQKFFALPQGEYIVCSISIHAPFKPFVAFTVALIFLRFIIQQQL
jgi:hypothetical protein